MKQEIKLEQYYSGDKSWSEFVEIAQYSSKISAITKIHLAEILMNHHDLANVIYYKMLDESFEWIERKIPALDHLTPLQCLESPELRKRLKEALMRMP